VAADKVLIANKTISLYLEQAMSSRLPARSKSSKFTTVYICTANIFNWLREGREVLRFHQYHFHYADDVYSSLWRILLGLQGGSDRWTTAISVNTEKRVTLTESENKYGNPVKSYVVSLALGNSLVN
jgi:hypothetical protein